MQVLQLASDSLHVHCRCIIGAFGALSSPLAGVMAEKLFGYSGGQHHAAVSSAPTAAAHAPGVHGAPVPTAHEMAATQAAARAQRNVQNAHSLENGLLVVTVAPTVSHLCHCIGRSTISLALARSLHAELATLKFQMFPPGSGFLALESAQELGRGFPCTHS